MTLLKHSRLSVKETTFRDILINKTWKKYKNNLTMQEMSHIFRMTLAQFYKIVNAKYGKKK